MRLREVSSRPNPKHFRALRSEEQMREDEDRKKESRTATKEEIEEEMKISVEERVTPYYQMTYAQQIEKKNE